MYAKSLYSLCRFFTPPNVEKLNLDVTELRGGGYAPAQFDGKLHDGREIYCRYRGGRLSITVAKEPNTDCLKDGTVVLDVQLGPPLHGGLTLGQLCHHTGITINGTMPPLPTQEEKHAEGLKDLSGDCSFFDFWVHSTHATQVLFLQRLIQSFYDLRFVQPAFTSDFKILNWEKCNAVGDVKTDRFHAVRDKKWKSKKQILAAARGVSDIRQLLPEAIIVDVRGSGFQYKIHKYGNDDASWVKNALGLEIKVAGQCDEMLQGNFSLHASYKNDDARVKQFIEELDSLIDEVYPAYRIEEIDLSTGDKYEETSYQGHFDPAIAEWLETEEHRWLYVRRIAGREKPRAIGQRLVPINQLN